jgi:endonuclease YncB( thermonuclease family)
LIAVNGLNISNPDYGHELWNNLAEEYTGKLVGVIDGNHRNPTHAAHQRIGVSVSMGDCPEYGQAYGKRAKQAASDLTFGRKKSRLRPTARTGTGGHLPMYCYRMAQY